LAGLVVVPASQLFGVLLAIGAAANRAAARHSPKPDKANEGVRQLQQHRMTKLMAIFIQRDYCMTDQKRCPERWLPEHEGVNNE